jgi:peptidoglycan hydrolase CwlO-like protein
LTELGVPYPAGFEYFKTPQFTIPSDTINNSYLWIKIDAEGRNFSSIPISLVQYPTYDDLQQQNNNLSSTLNDTQSQLTSVLSSLGSANSQINDLQALLNTTQSQLNSSQSQNIILQSQLDSTQSQLSGAQSLVNNLTIFSVIAVIAIAVLGLSTIYLMRRAK